MKAVEPILALPPGSHIWPLTVEAYRVLGEAGLIPKNTELLNGIVYNKMSKSPLHSALVRELLRLLAQIQPPGCFISSEQPITCGELSEPEPDVAIIRGAQHEFWKQHPHTAELVMEVCVTSHEYDRSKLSAYAAAGVKEVGFVLARERQIEVHREPAGGRFIQTALHGPGGTLTSTAVPAFAVDLNSLFRQ